MRHRLPPPLLRQPGFGLVEIMVALVIGMLAVIIMLQVFAQSEERKRISTTGGDAQTNGTLAFYQVQNDIAQAGFGISAMNLFNCTLTWKLPSGSSIANAIRLAPVTINPSTDVIPAGEDNTDTLLVVYGSLNGQPQGNEIMGGTETEPQLKPAAADAVAQNDRVIAAPDACSDPLILDRVATKDPQITLQTGATGTVFFNLGSQPRVLAYAVRQHNLTVCDYLVNDCGLAANVSDPSIWAPVANNIVSMRAVYLKDTSAPMDGFLDTKPGEGNQETPTSACGWARISAINMVLVARSVQFNQKPVDAPAPTWSDNDAAPIVLGAIDSADEPWKHYRYRTFESTVPLRNVGWMGAQDGC